MASLEEFWEFLVGLVLLPWALTGLLLSFARLCHTVDASDTIFTGRSGVCSCAMFVERH